LRRQIGFYLHRHVQELGLVAEILRLGFVDGRTAHYVHAFALQAVEGGVQKRCAVA
jgi:hypothetical protein